jgi:mannose-6-phosphate isomerase
MTVPDHANLAYPLLFHPLLKERVWGGTNLAAMGKPVPSAQTVGESWEIADLPDAISGGRSVIANGPLAGQTLRQAIGDHHDQIMGHANLSAGGGFPLLIKFLDARENLSVQVHPHDDFVAANPGCHLKSEAWIVVRAEPESVIYCGLQPTVTREAFQRHIELGAVVNDLRAIPAQLGQCHYLPSGTCHALGAGIVVAEIQTPSDTTFRVYDWGRAPGSGGERPLHIAQAMQCIQFGASAPEPTMGQRPMEVDGVRTSHLLSTEYFELERIDALRDVSFGVVTSGLPEVWMMLAGNGRVESPGCDAVGLNAGTTTLMPAALTGAVIQARKGAWLVRVRLPSPLKGMIA